MDRVRAGHAEVLIESALLEGVMNSTLASLLFVVGTNLAEIKRILLASFPVWLLAAVTLRSAELPDYHNA